MEKSEKKSKDKPVLDYLLNEITDLKSQLLVKKSQIIRLTDLSDVTTIISSTLNKTEILKRLLIQTKEIMACKKSSILLVDPQENNLRFEVLTEEEEMQHLKHIRLNMGEGIAGKVWETGKPILIKDTDKDIRFSQKVDEKTKDLTQSLIAAPLVIKGKIIGVMEALNKNQNLSFTDFDFVIFQRLAIHAAVAIENAELYMAGICDKMTGLFNHEYFMDQLEKEFQRSIRYKHTLSILIIDIDHFKNFNDTYGHQLGDLVIKEIAQLVKDKCRKELDSPCRYGGEEFTLILPETDKEGAVLFAERIRKNISDMVIKHQSEELNITVSGGVASITDLKPENKEAFIKMADSALYFSKKNGRNQISYFAENMLID